jgi:hypothetical protein
LLQASADGNNVAGVEAAGIGVFTEAGVAWEHGYAGVCLTVQRANSRLMPEWHRLTDRGERLQEDAFRLTHDFAWKILQRVEAEV